MPRKLSVFPSLLLVFLLWSPLANCQNLHPGHIQEKIHIDGSFTYTFNASGPIDIVYNNVPGASWEEIGINAGYEFTYTPEPGFSGLASFVVEWPTVLNREVVAYTRVDISVLPSLLTAESDYDVITESGGSKLIDVLANDHSNASGLTIVNTELVQNGSATIEGDGVRFTPTPGFVGRTSFVYTIEDNSDYTAKGIVVVEVFDGQNLGGQTLEYTVEAGDDVHILLDDNTYTLTEGEGVEQVDEYVWVFRAPDNAAGDYQLQFENGSGDEVHASVHVINYGTTGAQVNDDQVYTSVGTTVSFDPFENDYGIEKVLVDYSAELEWTGDHFVYTPQSDYEGYQVFFYRVFDGNQELEGRIEVFVGNYLPQRDEYQLSTKEGTPVAIQYDAPIQGYSWNQVDAPVNGNLTLNIRSYLPLNCEAIDHTDRMAIYTPNEGFTGSDEFTVAYCAPNGSCKDVKVFVEVAPATESCHCYGDECVWSGDADNNGKVSVQDLLGIGYNYGSVGTSRSNAGNAWCANYADDWSFDLVGAGINQKYADSNGDGVIDHLDTLGIAENYDNYHDLASREVLAEKDDILTFTPESDQTSDGNVLNIDVTLGSDERPVEDRQGISFGLQFPTDVIDPESIRFIPDTRWFGDGSPVMTMTRSKDGYIEIAMVRVSSRGTYGTGSLGTVQIEGVEDVDGWRPEDEEFEVDIDISEAVVTDGSGSRYTIQSEGLDFIFKLGASDKIVEEASVSIFPNPSEGQLKFRVGSDDLIQQVELHTITGARAFISPILNDRTYDLNHQLAEGMYVATVHTNLGVVRESVVVSR